MPKAFISGINGQGASYLAELLLEKGYEVVGMVRRSSTGNRSRISHIENDLQIETGDLLDGESLAKILNKHKPDEIYNLAAQSYVAASFDNPIYTLDVTGVGTARLLEAMRRETPDARLFQASSSEMFGNPSDFPQTEGTPFHPRSPYGVAKVAAHHLCVNYREAYGLHTNCGIMFNYESPRRSPEFVTRKITMNVARLAVSAWIGDKIKLGDLSAKRDWSHAKDTMYGAWLMLQQDKPDDYVIASGHSYSVKEFLHTAIAHAQDYVGFQAPKYESLYETDKQFMRPAEIYNLEGNSAKIQKLGWSPENTFGDLVKEMVESDIDDLLRPEKERNPERWVVNIND